MGWMSRMMGKGDARAKGNREQPNQGQPSQPDSKAIRYHAGLIDQYLATHQELVTLFAAIGDAARSGNLAAVPDTLTEFKTRLEGHLLNENVRFYGYVEQEMRGNPENEELIKSFRSEMHGIARQVTKFIRKWRASGVTAATVTEFLEEYRQIGIVLNKRLQSEEHDLYPLYQPPG